MAGRIVSSSQGVVARQPSTGIIVREPLVYEPSPAGSWSAEGYKSAASADFETAIEDIWTDPDLTWNPYCCDWRSMEGGSFFPGNMLYIRLTKTGNWWYGHNARGVQRFEVPSGARGQQLLGCWGTAGWANDARDSSGVEPPVYLGFYSTDVNLPTPPTYSSTPVRLYAPEVLDLPGYTLEIPKRHPPLNPLVSYSGNLSMPIELKQWLYVWFTAVPPGAGLTNPEAYLPVKGTDAEVYLRFLHQELKLST
jgi:hypothetical protein